MIVLCTLMFFGLIGFGVSKKYLQAYMLFAAFCISSLYLFFTPRPTWDLARHFEVLHELRRYDFLSVLTGNIKTQNYLLRDYIDHSRVYAIYAYIISRFNNDRLLPMISGFITYAFISRIIMMSADDVAADIEDWKVSFCFFFLLAALDFRSISGIRNMLAVSIFCYILYLDLCRNKSTYLCFAGYLILANIHSSIYIYLILRILLLFDKLIPEWVSAVLVLSSTSFLEVFTRLLSRFRGLETVNQLLIKIETYYGGFGTQAEGSYKIIWLLRIILTLFYLSLYIYTTWRFTETSKINDYRKMFCYIILFAIGSIKQLDVFLRTQWLMYFMVYPFILLFFKNILAQNPVTILVPEYSKVGFCEVVVYFMILAIIIVSLVIYMGGYYPSMNTGFHFNFL